MQGEVELGSGAARLTPSLIWVKAVGIEDGNCETVTCHRAAANVRVAFEIGVSNFDPRAALPRLMTLMRPLFAETFDDALGYVWSNVFGTAGFDRDL